MKWWGGFSLLALASAGVMSVSYVASVSPASARTQLSVPEDLHRLCEKRTFTRSELRALRRHAEYEQILRYTAQECAGVAGLLTGGATASTGGAGASGGDGDRMCDRDRFTRREIAAIQRRADFASLLDYTLAHCPAVAAVLINTPTASLPNTRDDDDDAGTGNGTGNGGGNGSGGGNGGDGNGGGGNGGGGDGNGGGNGDGGGNGGGSDNGNGDGHGGGKGGHDGKDHDDNGHGNDADGHDESNPGRGNGRR